MFLKVVLLFFVYNNVDVSAKSKKPYNLTRPASKYDNPKFIRDRYHDEIWKPIMDDRWVNRFRKPYHPAWMDYCDPYHCNDYHKQACGLNRKTMRFKWFQSRCHIILNNLCSKYRGALQYDVVDSRYCYRYIMFLRGGCPSKCNDDLAPVCGISNIDDDDVALFLNKCFMELFNCRAGILRKYEEVDMSVCSSAINI